MIVQHLIERDYRPEIDSTLAFNEQVVELARQFRGRLIRLVAGGSEWATVREILTAITVRQVASPSTTDPLDSANNSTRDSSPGPEAVTTSVFFNQPAAAETNFQMFCTALRPLLSDHKAAWRSSMTFEAGSERPWNKSWNVCGPVNSV